jgi:hypothetical protein
VRSACRVDGAGRRRPAKDSQRTKRGKGASTTHTRSRTSQ